MDELDKLWMNDLLMSAPGGIVKLAMDDMLTILSASDTFYSLVRNMVEKGGKGPQMLLRMVYSGDVIFVTQQIASQKNRKDRMISFHFRSLQEDGSFKWILITGNRIQETYSVGAKPVPVYACMTVDVTSIMLQYKELEQTVEYNRAITELSKELYFEYEIATDTLSFSEIFREIFGKDPVISGFRKRLEKTKIIHPDELPAVVGIFNSVMGGRKQVRFEMRLIPKDGRSCWYICYASIIFGENRNPHKVVGKLALINTMEKASEEEPYQPSIDTLTGVCTKEAMEVMIQEALHKQDSDTLSALMLIDIRNYKNLNEIKRAIQGENILTTVGTLLIRQFRTTDIIGRAGQSEFVVFIKNISADTLIYNKAERLCKALEALHPYAYTKNGLTASIGITLQRGRQEFQTVLANANTALVMAKKLPTSSFEVFCGTAANVNP
ncbi:diguanylate cyclase (GGDEF)-like protein [Anaerotaenia torta]|uniref:sensor domain-containing diguanylate cyclase n=1 Tax=Anaerotaenia torta TaxID=433293 RepID=UPI003D1C7648